jgi:uncharacterized protein YgiB involved in biofilm formation
MEPPTPKAAEAVASSGSSASGSFVPLMVGFVLGQSLQGILNRRDYDNYISSGSYYGGRPMYGNRVGYGSSTSYNWGGSSRPTQQKYLPPSRPSNVGTTTVSRQGFGGSWRGGGG